MPRTPIASANLLALAVPAALAGGALASQHLGGLHPCEMCYWQRWPHYAALGVAAVALVTPNVALKRVLVIAAAALIGASGVIGVMHAGVEYGWWEGFTACASGIRATGSAADVLAQIMAAPVTRCDVPQWTLGGVSLAGFNALFSLLGAIVIAVLALRRVRA
jgi:disulfide bond formation protein DsbB